MRSYLLFIPIIVKRHLNVAENNLPVFLPTAVITPLASWNWTTFMLIPVLIYGHHSRSITSTTDAVSRHSKGSDWAVLASNLAAHHLELIRLTSAHNGWLTLCSNPQFDKLPPQTRTHIHIHFEWEDVSIKRDTDETEEEKEDGSKLKQKLDQFRFENRLKSIVQN